MGLPVTSHKRTREDRSPERYHSGGPMSAGGGGAVHLWHSEGRRAVGDAHDWRALANSNAKPSNSPSSSPSSVASWGPHAHAPSAVEHGNGSATPSGQWRESGPGVSARVRLGGGAESQSPMERLDDALLLKIVQMSAPTAWDLCRMSCVSTAWRRACAHASFWTRLRVGSGSLRAGTPPRRPAPPSPFACCSIDPHLAPVSESAETATNPIPEKQTLRPGMSEGSRT